MLDREDRGGADWMRPLDDRILEVLQARGPLAHGQLLSVVVTATGPDPRSARKVDRRLAELRGRGLVEAEDDRLAVTTTGAAYLRGGVDADALGAADDADRR